MRALINERVHEYYWNQDLCCVLTTLKILAELFSFEFHPQVMTAAYGLNAGRLGSQCGLVEGTLMFIGIYGNHQGINSEEIKELCQRYANSFQQNFNSVLCRELRPQGFSPANPPHLCENLTKSAIAFSAEFLAREFADKVDLVIG